MIDLHINAASPQELLSDIRSLFPGLGLPPMQEQPSREPLPPENVKEVEPAPRRTRKPKEDAKASEGESAAATPEPSDSSTASSSATDTSQQSAESATDGAKADIPDIDDLRARLKTLGATEGFGHDKVFEVLGKYGAKNASTVPEGKRAECIAEIDGLLAK